MPINVSPWFSGLVVSLIFGGLVTWGFLEGLRHSLKLPKKPRSTSGVPPWVTGVIERLFFTVLVGFKVVGAPTAMIGWLALKLATVWNQPELKKHPNRKAFALSALLAGLISMLFAFIGGMISAGAIRIGI